MTSVEIAMSGTAVADPVEPLGVVVDRVLPAHPLEHRVVARLDGQVEGLADRRAVGHRLDQAVREVPRVRGDEPEPRDRAGPVGRAQAVDRADELREVRSRAQVELAAGPPPRLHMPETLLRREVVPVGVHVLAEQRDLAEALAAMARASSTMSSKGLDRSGPRLNGTMQ